MKKSRSKYIRGCIFKNQLLSNSCLIIIIIINYLPAIGETFLSFMRPRFLAFFLSCLLKILLFFKKKILLNLPTFYENDQKC